MLQAWGVVFPSFLQKAATLLLEDIEAMREERLDVVHLRRWANIFL